MSEMVERVADAICRELSIGDEGERKLLRIARAAVKAMREPTEEMVQAGGLMCDEGLVSEDRHRARGVYWAMIDAALADPE